MLLKERMDLLVKVDGMVPDWAPISRSVLIGLRGSDAHGTKIPKGPNDIDDEDVFSIIVHPLRFYLGLDGYLQKREHWDSSGEELDILVYDIRKFVHLAAQGNPNVLSWLWNRDEDYLLIDRFGQLLLDSKELFLSKHIFHRLAGYAFAQLKRMDADKKYMGYMGDKRKKLVEEYGYDLKNAAHCIRLMLMSIDLGRNGTLYSYRPDNERELIMDIKKGKYTLDEIVTMTDELKALADIEEAKSTLPKDVDRDKISILLENIILDFEHKMNR